MTSKNVEIEQYSEKAFAVRGETKEYKTLLSELGGKWNSRLKGGAGWIFPNSLRENVENWIKNDILVRNKRYDISTTTAFSMNISNLLNEMSEMKSEMKIIKNLLNKLLNEEDEEFEEEISDDEDEEEKKEEEEEEIPRKRLLKKKK
tara:strand:+ start:436 stop:876 length:441 start_codon:yes stop_codon:yes gene_type:complete